MADSHPCGHSQILKKMMGIFTDLSKQGSIVMSYAGDVSCAQCWEALQKNKNALLIDVRTNAEWSYVGLPDISSTGKEIILVVWQQFPQMSVNPSFSKQVGELVKAAGCDAQAELYFLCRSGVRSIAAAEAVTADGFSNAFNVLGGFEGNPDENGHRGNLQGWKSDGLPWKQK